MTPKVSICCVTYNHSNYIKKTLDSFVMQKTDFVFEVVIGDGCSHDGTTKIIEEYEKKYPDIIRPIYHTKHVGSYQNMLDVASACRSEYVAICDGDDYWIDECKLQKQVDFMDSHPEYIISFHPVIIKYEDGLQKDVIFPKPRHRFYKKTLELADLLKYNFIQTNSVMYRWIFCNNKLEEMLPKNILPVDYYIHLLHASKGKIGFYPDVMAVYRRHSNSIWYGVNSSDNWFLQYGLEHIRFYDAIEDNFNISKEKEKKEMIKNIALASLKHGNKKIINELIDNYADILQTAFTENKNILSKIRHFINRIKKRIANLISFIVS